MTWWQIFLTVFFGLLIGIPVGKAWADIVQEFLDERR